MISKFMADEMDYDQYDDYELDNRLRLASDKVPWKRKGTPGFSRDQWHWNPHIANISPTRSQRRLWTDKQLIARGSIDLFLYDRVYAEIWDHENNGSCVTNSPYSIIREELDKFIKTDADEKLLQYALQMFAQWLGSNCGHGFVDRAERYGKSETERLKEMISPGHIQRQQEEKERYKLITEETKQKIINDEAEKLFEKKAEKIINERVEVIRKNLIQKFKCLIKSKVKSILRKRKVRKAESYQKIIDNTRLRMLDL